MYYLIACERPKANGIQGFALQGGRLHRLTFSERCLVVGREPTEARIRQANTAMIMHLQEQGNPSIAPLMATEDIWVVLVLFRRGSGRRQYLGHVIIAENAAIFELSKNDHFMYIGGSFTGLEHAQSALPEIEERAVKAYCAPTGHSLTDLLPHQRKAFAGLCS